MKSFRVSILGSLLFFHRFTYANGEKATSYLQDIKPVLKERCFACHGALKQKGKLRLDTVTLMAATGSEVTNRSVERRIWIQNPMAKEISPWTHHPNRKMRRA